MWTGGMSRQGAITARSCFWRDNTANVAGGGANQEYLTDAVALSRSLGIVVAGAADGNVKFYGFGSQVPFSSYLLDATNETMAVDIAPTPNAVFPPVVAGGGRTLAAFDSAGILRWQLESLGNPGSRIVSLEMSDPGKYIAVGQESLVDGPAQVHYPARHHGRVPLPLPGAPAGRGW